MYPENRLFGIRNGSGSSLGYNLKFLSSVIEYIPSPHDLVSLSLVCHLYLPLSQKKVWGNPKFASYHKFQQFISTLSSPQQTLPYRTFVDVINLNGLTEITDHEFKVLAGCRRVKALEIPHCLKIDSPTLLHASYQYQQLGAVDFEGLQSVTDSVIAVLARNNPNLLGAKLGKCSRLTDAALLSLAAHCSKLQEVYLQHLPLITSQGLGELIKQCRALQTLDLSHCPGVDDESARLIWTSLSPLRKLLLAGCSTITDQMFLNSPNPTPLHSPGSDGPNQSSNHQGMEKPLPAAPMPLRLIHNLRHLDLTDCSLLSDFFIHLITTNSPKLHVLNLKNCCLLTDASLESMGACLGNSLHQLILAKVPEITDAGIIALTRRCRKITSLDLSECKNLTDVSVQSIATLSRIESLRFNSIENITDTGITWLGSLRRPSLKRLHLSFCKGVTPLSIYHFLTKQPQLNFLSVSGVPSFLDNPRFLELSKASERGWKPETFRVYSGEESILALRDMLVQLYSSATAAQAEGRGQSKGKASPPAMPLPAAPIPSSHGPSLPPSQVWQEEIAAEVPHIDLPVGRDIQAAAITRPLPRIPGEPAPTTKPKPIYHLPSALAFATEVPQTPPPAYTSPIERPSPPLPPPAAAAAAAPPSLSLSPSPPAPGSSSPTLLRSRPQAPSPAPAALISTQDVKPKPRPTFSYPPDPIRRSGSISSFEDLEDGEEEDEDDIISYDILAESDFGSDNEALADAEGGSGHALLPQSPAEPIAKIGEDLSASLEAFEGLDLSDAEEDHSDYECVEIPEGV
ncbi:hypothetical protein D9611_011976 [Ephemerocybe angulata]|uniref:F-box/LRR-repeat protein 15-like leucin rich repeat domain-containing protein n=1 Tax=Ephemerocybe angulata TaxID=980116 RepID=A0A8H5C3L2_9AGAR|nr:hypothetical protein D9611_011976 [Tulosesus angulatus]